MALIDKTETSRLRRPKHIRSNRMLFIVGALTFLSGVASKSLSLRFALKGQNKSINKTVDCSYKGNGKLGKNSKGTKNSKGSSQCRPKSPNTTKVTSYLPVSSYETSQESMIYLTKAPAIEPSHVLAVEFPSEVPTKMDSETESEFSQALLFFPTLESIADPSMLLKHMILLSIPAANQVLILLRRHLTILRGSLR